MINILKERYDLNDLVEIVSKLRGPDGCPWDQVQNHESLKKCLIEEAYEVLEAIDLKDNEKLCEELGDLLLQSVFHAQLAKEENSFDINDVIDGISKKLIARHSHVFGDDIASTPEDVIVLWEKRKNKEKGKQNYTELIKDVPSNLPALMRSYKVQQKAAQAGFDWDKVEDAFQKVKEEVDELEEVYKSDNEERASEELGDLLFSVVNVARFLSIQPEIALSDTIAKFIDRFEFVESKALQNGKRLEDMTLNEMDVFWEEAKGQAKNK